MKRALIRVSMGIIENLLKGQWPSPNELWSDAPADMRVVGIHHAPAGEAHNWFYTVVESETFDEVKPGGVMPELPGFLMRRL